MVCAHESCFGDLIEQSGYLVIIIFIIIIIIIIVIIIIDIIINIFNFQISCSDDPRCPPQMLKQMPPLKIS